MSSRAFRATGTPSMSPRTRCGALPAIPPTWPDYLKTVPGPIISPGTPTAGMVITNAATGHPAVKALVYIDAFIPAQGETLLQLAGAKPGSTLADPTKAFNCPLHGDGRGRHRPLCQTERIS